MCTALALDPAHAVLGRDSPSVLHGIVFMAPDPTHLYVRGLCCSSNEYGGELPRQYSQKLLGLKADREKGLRGAAWVDLGAAEPPLGAVGGAGSRTFSV